MVGSSLNISGPNIVLNTIVAEELEQFADELEKADDFKKALKELLVKTIKGAQQSNLQRQRLRCRMGKGSYRGKRSA